MRIALPASPMRSEDAGSLYASGMVRFLMLGVQQLRLRLSERVDALEGDPEKGKPAEETVIQKRGKVIGVMLPIAQYREYRELKGDPTEL